MKEDKLQNQRMACLALHLIGQSNKKQFKYLKEIQSIDFIHIGQSLYGENFKKMMENAYTILQIQISNNIKLLTICDNEYPYLLSSAINPPLALFYMGEIGLLSQPLISIVGTREPSLFTYRWVKDISEFLSKKGYTLVSGLAKGVDAIVHAASISTGTIGVCPQSLDIKYPIINKYLFDAANKGRPVLLLSEYPMTTAVRKYHYVHRNRIIAGLSKNIIFAEGAENSGAMITADWASKNHRNLFVLSSEIQRSNSGGEYLLNKNLAKNISDCFPVHIFERSPEIIDKSFMESNQIYLGNRTWVFIDYENFSTKFL